MRISLLLLSILIFLSCSNSKQTNSEQTISSALTDTAAIVKNGKEKKIEHKPAETICSELIKKAILSKDSVRLLHLLDSGCNVNAINRDYEYELKYPLYWAVKSKEIRLVKLLLKNGANPNIDLNKTLSPIQLSTFSHIPRNIFYELIKYDIEVNTFNGWAICETPLLCAIGYGSIDIAQKIIELGAVLDPDSVNGFTSPLYAAAINNKWGFFDYLLKLGANPNAKFSLPSSGDCSPCPEGITVLNTVSGNLDAIKILMDYGADINIEDDEGNNLLEHIASGAKPEIVQYLIDNGSKLGEAINNASYFQNYEVVKVLLENGANPNQPSNYYLPLEGTLTCCGDGMNQTPIEPRLRVAKLLLDYGAIPKDSIQIKFLKESFNKHNIK